MKLLLVDNNDSFTYNLVQLIEECKLAAIDVLSHDLIQLEHVGQYDKILISPGPSLPNDFPIIKQIISTYSSTKSILGVCLGMQAIAEFFGGELRNLSKVVHGQERRVDILEEDIIYRNIPSSFQAGLYHSWTVKDEGFPNDLIITARSEKGIIMSLRHKKYDLRGVQFHPESIITKFGSEMICNWLKY